MCDQNTVRRYVGNELREFHKVTFRATGKAHRGFLMDDGKGLFAACTCPGSRNGRLASRAVVIAKGWEKATCEG